MAGKRGAGHLAYYAVPGNNAAAKAFRDQAIRHWRRALRRRSQRTRLNWAPDEDEDSGSNRLVLRWLPGVRIADTWPSVRVEANNTEG